MQRQHRSTLTDFTGLQPDKCRNPECGAGQDRLVVTEQYEIGVVVPEAMTLLPISFDHRRRSFKCGACAHEWNLDRFVNVRA